MITCAEDSARNIENSTLRKRLKTLFGIGSRKPEKMLKNF